MSTGKTFVLMFSLCVCLFVVENDVPHEARAVHEDDAVGGRDEPEGEGLYGDPDGPEREHGRRKLVAQRRAGLAPALTLHQADREKKSGRVEQRRVHKVVKQRARETHLQV